MSHPASRRTPVLAACALLTLPVLLTGCQDSPRSEPTEADGPTAQSTSAQALPGPSEEATTQVTGVPLSLKPSPTSTCSDKSGAEALSTWVSRVRTFRGWAWDTTYTDTSTYDPCAALSWIVLSIEMGTVSSPCQIMLFHHGEYIGVTSDRMIGFYPKVVRLGDGVIQVTYTWPRENEANAMASGRSVSIFTWDEASSSVVHSGEWPPTND